MAAPSSTSLSCWGLVLQGAEGQKPGFGYGGRVSDYKSAHKGLKGADAQSTLSRLFKLVRTPGWLTQLVRPWPKSWQQGSRPGSWVTLVVGTEEAGTPEHQPWALGECRCSGQSRGPGPGDPGLREY